MSQDPVPPPPPWPMPPGGPPSDPAGTVPPSTPAARWRSVPVVAAVLVGVVLLTACGFGVYLLARGDAAQPAPVTDETRIRGLVEDFAAAVDQRRQSSILDLLCTEEAEEFQADDDFEPSPEPLADPPSARPVTATDIRVLGDTATAAVSRPGQQDVTLSFRKENGAWKVCAPAGDASTPTPATPSN